MSQRPPQTLQIKRKREEDPADILFIEGAAKAKIVGERRYVFRRLKEAEDSSAFGALGAGTDRLRPQRAISAMAAMRPPVVRATQPGEEDLASRSQLVSDQNGTTISAPPSVEASPVVSRPSSGTTTPRRFHLSKHSISSYQRPLASDIHKRRYAHRQEVAVFVERRSPRPQSRGKASAQTDADTAGKHELTQREAEKATNVEMGEVSPQRKRPHVPAAEKAHIAKTWAVHHQKSADDRGALIRDEPSEELMQKMQQFAEEVEHEEQAKAAASPSKLKYKPKAPALRYHERHPEEFLHQDEKMDVDMEDEGDYVYDTYIRHRDDESSFGPVDLDQGNIGVLVIEEEDQELWETFAEDDETDKEFETDEEDENAEDWYGADYPEDEVDTDDEYNMGAYQYRRGASDDEEYDADGAAWSDEEDDLRYPWKRNPRTQLGMPHAEDESDAEEA